MASLGARAAKALFELCIERSCLDNVYPQAQSLLKILRNESEFIPMLSDPRLDAGGKAELLEQSLNGARDELKGLAHVLLGKRREDELIPALISFLALAKEEKGILSAEARSAAPLSKEQLSALKRKLEDATGKTVEVEESVDPSLIGGIAVKANGLWVDATIKSQLERFRKGFAV